MTTFEGKDTLYDLVEDSVIKYPTRKCLGSREFLGWKTPKVKHFGDNIKWKTYEEFGEASSKFGAALRSAGLQPAPYTTTLDKVKTPCRIAIFENTCAEWLTAAMGAFTQSISVVTVYATLGMDAVVEAIVDNIVPVIVCNKKDVAKVCEKIKKMPTLTHIVYTNDLVAPDDKIDLPKAPRGVQILSFEEFIATGDETAYPPTPPQSGTCAVVMYTSGSTGKPKGVVITHGQLVAVIAAGDVVFGIKNGEDVYLAYCK